MPAITDEDDKKEIDVLVRSVTNMFDQYVKMNKKVPPEILSSLPVLTMPIAWPT